MLDRLERLERLGEAAIKAVVARLAQGEAVAALARKYGTSRQSIMRIRQANSPETHITKADTNDNPVHRSTPHPRAAGHCQDNALLGHQG